MPSLDERETFIVRNCNHCKYCVSPCGYRISKDGKIRHTFEYLCMLDSPEETRKFVYHELSKLMHEDKYIVQSEELLQILQMDEPGPFTSSPRCVSDMVRCQFYELKDCWKDDKDIVKPLTVFEWPCKEKKEEEQDG